MINHYHSPYSNYAHQFFITPSRHLYVLKDRRLKWQDKAMEVNLEKIEDAGREHLVHYIVADHASAAFYAELSTSRALVSPIEFLTRAWRKKPNFFFHGVPEYVLVPTIVSNKYPEINGWLEQLGVVLIPPSSGFQAGVHHVRNWEKELAENIDIHNFTKKIPYTLDNIFADVATVLRRANEREINRPGIRMTRKQLWETQIEGRLPIRALG